MKYFLSLIMLSALFLGGIYTNIQAQFRKKATPRVGYQQKQNPLMTTKPVSKKGKNPPKDIKSVAEVDEYIGQGKPVVLMIHASWCGACKISMDPFAQAAEDNPHITFLKAEGSKEVPDIAKRYALRGFPTFVLLDAQGKEVHKFSGGGWPKSVLNEKIKNYIK